MKIPKVLKTISGIDCAPAPPKVSGDQVGSKQLLDRRLVVANLVTQVTEKIRSG